VTFDHLSPAELERGRRNAVTSNRLRRELKRDLRRYNVDPVALVLGELDDEVYGDEGEEYTYWRLIRRVTAWNVVLWTPRVAETRGVTIFSLANVPAGDQMWRVGAERRERLAKALDLIAIPRRDGRRW
jgi:hypothetical protein